MDYLNNNISINLRRIRKSKRMSLDAVAEQTGVSKSMLGQIERGEANPTVSILGKIVNGLHVELNELVCMPPQDIYYMKKNKVMTSKETEGQYTVYSYFPYEEDRNFKIYVIEIAPGGVYRCNSHGEKTREYITVMEGTLTICIEHKDFVVHSGDAFSFASNRDHDYINKGGEKVLLNVIFVF